MSLEKMLQRKNNLQFMNYLLGLTVGVLIGWLGETNWFYVPVVLSGVLVFVFSRIEGRYDLVMSIGLRHVDEILEEQGEDGTTLNERLKEFMKEGKNNDK